VNEGLKSKIVFTEAYATDHRMNGSACVVHETASDAGLIVTRRYCHTAVTTDVRITLELSERAEDRRRNKSRFTGN